MYPIIKLGVINIPTYGLMAILGFSCAVLLFIKLAKRYEIQTDDCIYASIYCIVGVLIGAKLMNAISLLPRIITHMDVVKKYPFATLQQLFGGYVFYGGLIGGALGVVIYCKKFKLPLFSFMDAAAPVIPFMHAFGRVGCFLAGCCYGVEYDGFFSVTFPTTGYTADIGGVPRIPTQLIEVVYDLILFVILFIYMKSKPKPGRGLGIYVIAYTIMRFIIEFFRGDIVRGEMIGISTSQWVSLFLLPVGIWMVRGIPIGRSKHK